MPANLANAKLTCRFADRQADFTACQSLRRLSFFGDDGLDADQFDPLSQHLMVERDGGLVCTMRLRVFADGDQLTNTYTGSFYDLSALYGPAIEVGRFCLKSGRGQADVLRAALMELTRLVDAHQVAFLFGCTSFAGNGPAVFKNAFGLLADKFQGQGALLPQPLSDQTYITPCGEYDPTAALREMPPLLRSYLAMNGWVGDKVIVDKAMNTMHIFTCLDVARVPEARAKALREGVGPVSQP